MTPEQFEALKIWVDRAATAIAMRLNGEDGLWVSAVEDQAREAERRVGEAFLGKTHEQPRG